MKFKVGDIVEYEIAANPRYSSYYNGLEPRWNCGKDQGETGRFVRGKVINAYGNNFEIEINNFKWWFCFPNSDQPGFPRVISEKEKISAKIWMWSK